MGSSLFYVGLYRKELEEVARFVSGNGIIVRTRFNKNNRCAELYYANGIGVFAEVRVEGEYCSPNKVIVISEAISDTYKGFFTNTLPLRVEFITSS